MIDTPQLVREFHVGCTTHTAVGSDLTDRIGAYTATYGDRALIVAGQSHARESGLLLRVEGSLRAAGVEFELLEGIGSNPSAALIDAGALLVRSRRIQVVVAVGGGSVIDAAKAIATSAASPEPRPFREHLSGLRPTGFLVDSALPVVALPTLPGSGSETNGTSVITDDETGRKLSAHSDLAAPRIALIDPELMRDCPIELLGPGLMDGICHALEAALSTHATIASRSLSEQALRMLLRTAADPPVVERADRSEQLAAAWWATNLAGQALTQAGSLVTHPLAHPLSARLDARHGSAVAALEPAVLVTFASRLSAAGSLQRVASWLDVRGSEDADAALRGIITRLARAAQSLHVRASVTDLGLAAGLEGEIVRDARASGSRGLSSLPGDEPSADELFRVLDLAQRCGPTTTAKKLLATAQQLNGDGA